MATKYIVNNVTGQTINGSLTINGDVVITGTTNTRPYKVYTALLSQSGGDDPFSINTPESLVIGQTYSISYYQPGDDFTNVGAPSNATDVWFVATGTTPAVWTNGSSLFTNGGAPVSTVLENTIGNIWFGYEDSGSYPIFSNGLFTLNKFWAIGGNASGYNTVVSIALDSTSTAYILTGQGEDVLLNTPIEIRVYN